MSGEQQPKKPNWKRYAVIAGVLLALICKSLPPDYRGICETLSSICSGGF